MSRQAIKPVKSTGSGQGAAPPAVVAHSVGIIGQSDCYRRRNEELLGDIHQLLEKLPVVPRYVWGFLRSIPQTAIYDVDIPAVLKGYLIEQIRVKALPWRLFTPLRQLYRRKKIKLHLSPREACHLYQEFMAGKNVMEDERFTAVHQAIILKRMNFFMAALGESMERLVRGRKKVPGCCSGFSTLSIAAGRSFSLFKWYRRVMLYFQQANDSNQLRVVALLYRYYRTDANAEEQRGLEADKRLIRAKQVYQFIQLLLFAQTPARMTAYQGKLTQSSLPGIFNVMQTGGYAVVLGEVFKLCCSGVTIDHLVAWFQRPGVLQHDSFFRLGFGVCPKKAGAGRARYHAVSLQVTKQGRLLWLDSNQKAGAIELSCIKALKSQLAWFVDAEGEKTIRISAYQFSDRQKVFGVSLEVATHLAATQVFMERYLHNSIARARLMSVMASTWRANISLIQSYKCAVKALLICDEDDVKQLWVELGQSPAASCMPKLPARLFLAKPGRRQPSKIFSAVRKARGIDGGSAKGLKI